MENRDNELVLTLLKYLISIGDIKNNNGYFTIYGKYTEDKNRRFVLGANFNGAYDYCESIIGSIFSK